MNNGNNGNNGNVNNGKRYMFPRNLYGASWRINRLQRYNLGPRWPCIVSVHLRLSCLGVAVIQPGRMKTAWIKSTRLLITCHGRTLLSPQRINFSSKDINGWIFFNDNTSSTDFSNLSLSVRQYNISWAWCLKWFCAGVTYWSYTSQAVSVTSALQDGRLSLVCSSSTSFSTFAYGRESGLPER